MESYSYKVIPFRARVVGQGNPVEIAVQLESTISQHAVEGFELLQVATVTVDVAPGCLGSLLGQKTQEITYEQLVFRRRNDSLGTRP
jgi:hypothetical protein